jgi:hypothetical protein
MTLYSFFISQSQWPDAGSARPRGVGLHLVASHPGDLLLRAKHLFVGANLSNDESNSSHLPPSGSSLVPRPVMFPLGPRRQGAVAKTVRIVRVSRWRATVAGVELDRVTSGCRLSKPCASARLRLGSSPAQRRSIRTLGPTVQAKPANAGFRPGIVFVAPDEHTDRPNALVLLRRPQARPRHGTARPCYEIAPSHRLPR